MQRYNKTKNMWLCVDIKEFPSVIVEITLAGSHISEGPTHTGFYTTPPPNLTPKTCHYVDNNNCLS